MVVQIIVYFYQSVPMTMATVAGLLREVAYHISPKITVRFLLSTLDVKHLPNSRSL